MTIALGIGEEKGMKLILKEGEHEVEVDLKLRPIKELMKEFTEEDFLHAHGHPIDLVKEAAFGNLKALMLTNWGDGTPMELMIGRLVDKAAR